MNIARFPWLKRFGIGSWLFLAFVLISSITLVTGGLATRTYLALSDKLSLLKQQEISGLEAAARLNDKNRLIVATAPLLVTSESNYDRRKAMSALHGAIADMDQLMRNLPDYNSYFRELIMQIQNSLTLLNQSVERRQKIRRQIDQQSQLIFPLYQQIIAGIQQYQQQQLGAALNKQTVTILSRLNYLSALVEKVNNDASFNELDYTFLRLEVLGEEIRQNAPLQSDNGFPAALVQRIELLLQMSSRKGLLFKLKNEELDLRYQQSFFLENSQRHIQQLAAQINRYTNQANARIGGSIDAANASMKANLQVTLLLSLASLVIACAISWFYVRRNVLHRVQQLQQNMRAIASGQLETQIRIAGHDEISAMAMDLQHFQQTAIEVERTNQQLAAEVEERVAAEKQLRATQNELIQAGKLAALGHLSVGITHEINQPLTAIGSHLHTAKRRLEKEQPDKALLSLDKIQNLLNKTAAITRHLKAFARKAEYELMEVDLSLVIADAVALMGSRQRELDCQIENQLDGSLPLVWAEPIRLEQVLVNLLSNALDAVEGRGNRQVRLSVRVQRDQVLLEVTDNGVGMEESLLSQIFDPFFTSKEVGRGLGLGLSISYNIVQDFGGQISVQSTPNVGSSFSLALNKAEK